MAKYKYEESGIEWVDFKPTHWKIKRVKDIFNDEGGNGFPLELQGNEDGDFPFLKASDINHAGETVTIGVNYVNEPLVKEMGWKIIPKNSILTAKIGEAMKKNHRKINTVDCLIDNNLMALIIRNEWECDIRYFNWLFKDIDFAEFEKPGTVPSLNMKVFRHFKILVPPKDEQTQIANYLDKVCADIDLIINLKVGKIKFDDNESDSEVNMLRKYKSALINETVTGRKQVYGLIEEKQQMQTA